MLWRSCWLAMSFLLAAAPLSWGQVVQLPTFGVFSVQTTVVVPDRGSAYLGGVSRARYGSSTYGTPGLSRIPGAGRLFTNRSSGASVSTSDAYVSATIIDLEELDRAVLAAAARGRAYVSPADLARQEKASFIARHIDRTGAAPRTSFRASSTKSLDRGMAEKRTAEASPYEVFRTAQQAEAAGRLGAARCGYRRVERMGSSTLAAHAKARLAALAIPDATTPETPVPDR